LRAEIEDPGVLIRTRGARLVWKKLCEKIAVDLPLLSVALLAHLDFAAYETQRLALSSDEPI
jgi:hypothetical protein